MKFVTSWWVMLGVTLLVLFVFGWVMMKFGTKLFLEAHCSSSYEKYLDPKVEFDTYYILTASEAAVYSLNPEGIRISGQRRAELICQQETMKRYKILQHGF